MDWISLGKRWGLEIQGADIKGQETQDVPEDDN